MSGDSGPCAMRLASINKESGSETGLATIVLHKMEGGLVMETQVNHIHVVRRLAIEFICLFVYLYICLSFSDHIYQSIKCSNKMSYNLFRIPNHLLLLNHAGLI